MDDVADTAAPRRGRFEKGRSGNPAGRPRRSSEPNASAFDVIVAKTLTVSRDGGEREISVEEALQHRTYKAALAGDGAAQRKILKMIAKREAALSKTRERSTSKVDVKKEAIDPRNVDDALLLLGIACEDPRDDHKLRCEGRRLLLEQWAVQAALSRRRGGARLEDRDVETIKRCTRDTETLRWPRSVKR